jgi:hypothetical protein
MYRALTFQDFAKVVLEREMQFTQWRAELDIRSKQFEELKDQVIPPHELEEIRFRMAEELDLPNREKCAALEAELERSREDYFQLRRTVYIYICIYIYIHTYIHTYIYIHIYIYI